MKSYLQGLLLFTVLLGACGKSKESAPTPTPSGQTSAASAPVAKAPLRIGYSDWPGFVAWEVALQKGWFKQAGLDVDFVWFEYVPSMEAYTAGKLDAVSVTNGDALVMGSSGAKSVAILLNDYSNGNDMIVAKRGLTKLTELKGKKVGVEVGFVSHLLLIKALEKEHLSPSDLSLVNVPTDQTPQLLKSGSVDAVVAWQPSSGQALKEVPGSTAIFTSRDVPGLIYDLLAVNPKSLAERRDDWKRLVKVWFRVVDFLKDPANAEEAAKLMAGRVGLTPEQYKPLMAGTYFLDLADELERFKPGDSLASAYFSSKTADEFQVRNDVYKASVPYEQYFDPTLVAEVAKELEQVAKRAAP
ncbi:MAG: ABC transporter substrate-binding protein [Myxococcales bacterium]